LSETSIYCSPRTFLPKTHNYSPVTKLKYIFLYRLLLFFPVNNCIFIELIQLIVLSGYQCDRCGKVFTYEYYKEKHLKYTRCVDQGNRKFRCLLCPRSFEKRDRLRIHVLHVHENHRPHVCSACGKSFSQSSSLNKHLRVHSGERPYKCEHCGKRFTASSILRTHIRQHSGEKPFQCSTCGKTFASHAAHDSHVRRTHLVGFRILN
uniref:Protein krueppel n=1 Tax=Enterobius vermicularis TaxID=51028 RepID=A0A0N4UVB4_ENTVE